MMLNLTNMCGFAGKTPVAEAVFSSSAYDETALTTYTFSSKAIGDASSNRLVIVCVASHDSASGTVSSATIGGISATILLNTGISNGSLSIISAMVPTGTTATVVVTWSAQQLACSIAIFSAYNLSSITPAYTGTDVASPLSISATVPPLGFIIAHAKNNNASIDSFTWSGTLGISEVYDLRFNGTVLHGAALKNMEGGGSGTIVATPVQPPSGEGMQYVSFA